jgi:hypothetical protein
MRKRPGIGGALAFLWSAAMVAISWLEHVNVVHEMVDRHSFLGGLAWQFLTFPWWAPAMTGVALIAWSVWPGSATSGKAAPTEQATGRRDWIGLAEAVGYITTESAWLKSITRETWARSLTQTVLDHLALGELKARGRPVAGWGAHRQTLRDIPPAEWRDGALICVVGPMLDPLETGRAYLHGTAFEEVIVGPRDELRRIWPPLSQSEKNRYPPPAKRWPDRMGIEDAAEQINLGIETR